MKSGDGASAGRKVEGLKLKESGTKSHNFEAASLIQLHSLLQNWRELLQNLRLWKETHGIKKKLLNFEILTKSLWHLAPEIPDSRCFVQCNRKGGLVGYP